MTAARVRLPHWRTESRPCRHPRPTSAVYGPAYLAAFVGFPKKMLIAVGKFERNAKYHLSMSSKLGCCVPRCKRIATFLRASLDTILHIGHFPASLSVSMTIDSALPQRHGMPSTYGTGSSSYCFQNQPCAVRPAPTNTSFSISGLQLARVTAPDGASRGAGGHPGGARGIQGASRTAIVVSYANVPSLKAYVIGILSESTEVKTPSQRT